MSLNATPRGDRIHIALFGKRNAGKSSVINAMTNQELAIVSDVKGTTTDPVYKAMELLPLGPVGQRRGLGLSLKKPGYVIKVDKDTNEVVVGDKQDLFANVLYGNKVNCMSVPEFEDGMKLMAKIRYNSPEVPCRVYMTGEDEVRVVFDEPQRAITPGQAVVFYDGDIVAGGATILRAANENM